MLLGKNWIDFRDIQILQNCCTVPPNTSELPLMGKLSIELKIQHLDLPFDKEFQYRFYLWGQQQPIYFENMKSELKIAANYSNLSKYFHDMDILCIHIISLLPYNQKNLIKTKSQKNFKKGLMEIQKQKKIVGYVFVPLRRFFVNNLLSNFNQTFFIVDLNKKKIGETYVNLNIEMLQNQGRKYRQYLIGQGKLKILQPIESMKYSQQEKSEKQKRVAIQKRQKKTVSIAGNIKFSDEEEQESDNQDKNLIENHYKKKSYFTHEKLDQDLNFELQDEENIQEQIKKNERTVKQLQSKNTNQQKLIKKNISNKNNTLPEKKQHTDLSLIRQKWGSNNPTIELMKLRLDQVKYLQDEDNQSKYRTKEEISEMTQIRIYLKKLVPIVGKITTNQFMIHYSKKSKIVSTELTLEPSKDQKQNKLINHLLVLSNPNLDDLLSFQTKETISEFKLSEIVNRTSVELRKKDTKRRAVQLKFQILSNLTTKSQQIKKPVQSKNNIRNPQNRQLNNSPKKSPKNIKNVNAAQKQNGFMQPSPTGELQKLSVLQKQLLNRQQLLNRSQINTVQYLKMILNIYTLLYESQNEKFYQLIMKILTLEQKNCSSNNHITQQKKVVEYQYQRQKFIDRLQTQLLQQQQVRQTITVNPPINLQKILIKIFNNNFRYFFQCFQGFKQINHKYQMVTYKLTKKLSSPHQNILLIISKIIQHIKKYKKTQISFGLIHSNIIFQQFSSFLNKHIQKQKQFKSQEEKEVQQSELQNIKFFVQCFLKLFQRYNSQLIKISEISQFVKQFNNYDKKKRVFEQALIHSINFGNLIVLLKETSKYQQENSLQTEKNQNYEKLSTNQFYRMFIQNADKEHLNQKQMQIQSKITLFQILFNDLLTQNLHEAQSSLNFDEQANMSQRIQTQAQMNDRIRTQSLRQNTQGEDLRLKTEEMVNQEKRRLNTEDENVIELFNKQKSKEIKQDNEGEIQIQFTKREKIFKEDEEQHIHSRNQEINRSQNGINLNLHQHSLSMICEQPDTKYINIRISQINLHQYKSKILQARYIQTKQQSRQNAQFTQQLKLNQFMIIPNCQKKTFSVQILLQNSHSSRSDLSQIMDKKILLNVRNVCGIQSYSIDDENQGIILAMIEIQIQTAEEEQFLTKELNQKNQQNNFDEKTQQITFLNVIRLYSLDKLQINCNYRVIVEQQNQVIIKQTQFQQNYDSTQEQYFRQISLNIGKIPLIPFRGKKSSPISIKIFQINKKLQGNKSFKSPLKTQKQLVKFDGDQICEFSFLNQLKTNQLGIQKASKWLMDNKFRLQIEIFNTIFLKQGEDNINSQKVSTSQIWSQKINNLLNVFECKNKTKIRNDLLNKSQKYSQKEHNLQFLLNVIREKMSFRLTQMQILTLILFPEEQILQSDKTRVIFQLFNNNAAVQSNEQLRKWSLNNLYEEFQIFDFQNFGVVKKINGIVFKKAVPALTVDLQTYVIFPQKNCQILDLKLKKMTQNQVNSIELIDYFKILWDLRMICTDNYFFCKKPQDKLEIGQQQEIEKINKSKKMSQIYSKIRIQSFCNVSLNEKSCNILFYLQKPYQKLDQSAHRCHNQIFQKKKYGYSNQNTIKIGVYIKQYQGNAKKELYTQRRIQQLIININDRSSKTQNKWIQQYKLKIFNGEVNIELQIITKEEFKVGLEAYKKNQKFFQPLDKKNQTILQEKIEISKKNNMNSLEKQFFQLEDVQEQQKIKIPTAQIQKSFQNTKNEWIKANTNQKNTKLLNLSQNLNQEQLQLKFNIQSNSSDEDQ